MEKVEAANGSFDAECKALAREPGSPSRDSRTGVNATSARPPSSCARRLQRSDAEHVRAQLGNGYPRAGRYDIVFGKYPTYGNMIPLQT